MCGGKGVVAPPMSCRPLWTRLRTVAGGGRRGGRGPSSAALPLRAVHVMAVITTGEPIAPALDRSKFDALVRLPALRVPSKRTQEFMTKLRGYTLNKPRMKCVLHDGSSPDHRLLLLNEELSDSGMEGLPAAVREELRAAEVEVVAHELSIGYDYWTVEHVLKDILPSGTEVPSSFETIGHIAHLNLREELLPYKHIIGQVILDKNPRMKTVVNKVGSITNEFRVFQMEVIAGKADLETEVRQHSTVFKLNFGEVYWNSRLESEHHRLVSVFQRGQTVVDMMCGIGPFAVPAAQKGCTVYANDLNPRSVHWLRVNVKTNRVEGAVHTYNMCAREFVRMLQTPHPSGDGGDNQETAKSSGATECDSPPPAAPVIFHHAVMNLPASAVEFLDAFNGVFDQAVWAGHPLPMIHCHCFARSHETKDDIQARCEGHLGGKIDTEVAIHNVRNVSPNKDMFCVSFRLPAAIAFGSKRPPTSVEETEPKKPRAE